MISKLISSFNNWRAHKAKVREFRKCLEALHQDLVSAGVSAEDREKVFLVIAGELPQSALDELFPPGLKAQDPEDQAA